MLRTALFALIVGCLLGAGEWAVRTGGENDYITPSSANIIKAPIPKLRSLPLRTPMAGVWL